MFCKDAITILLFISPNANNQSLEIISNDKECYFELKKTSELFIKEDINIELKRD